MQKVAVVGQKNFVNVFKMVGCEVFIVETSEDAASLIERLVGENFVLIFITSSLAKQMSTVLEKYSLSSAPIVSKIPG